MKQLFKQHKYLLPSASLLIAIIVMVAFDAGDVTDFFQKIGNALFYAVLASVGIYILAMFSMWLFYPWAPKHEDFANDDERNKYFKWFPSDLLLFIFLVVAAALVFGGLTQ